MRHSRLVLSRSRTIDPNACFKISFSSSSVLSMVPRSLLLLLCAEGCAHDGDEDIALDGDEEDPVENGSGCRKSDIAESSVARSLSMSQMSRGVAIGWCGRSGSIAWFTTAILRLDARPTEAPVDLLGLSPPIFFGHAPPDWILNSQPPLSRQCVGV